jgi:hypothetical protein
VRYVSIAACAAAALLLSGAPDARASGRQTPKLTATNSANYSSATTNSSSPADGAKFERKCVIMSCGTPWCYNTRIK